MLIYEWTQVYMLRNVLEQPINHYLKVNVDYEMNFFVYVLLFMNGHKFICSLRLNYIQDNAQQIIYHITSLLYKRLNATY